MIELLVTMVTVGMLGIALGMFSFSSSRFIARNLATNHSHEATRISSQSLLKELRDAASSFRLFNYDGTNYTDVTAIGTNDLDALSGQYAGNRTNGVRYRQLVAGPVTLTGNTNPLTSTLVFNFSGNNPDPMAGDKLVLPLISQEYDVTSVSGAGMTRAVTISPAVGYSLNTSSPNVITGYFYRRVAFSVYNNQLRYHSNFNGPARDTFRVVRDGITSPKPFSLLFPVANGTSTEALSLRVSMEITDLGYSARKFGNGTTTLYSIIPARNQPTALSSNN
jgi:hypothetical protein